MYFTHPPHGNLPRLTQRIASQASHRKLLQSSLQAGLSVPHISTSTKSFDFATNWSYWNLVTGQNCGSLHVRYDCRPFLDHLAPHTASGTMSPSFSFFLCLSLFLCYGKAANLSWWRIRWAFRSHCKASAPSFPVWRFFALRSLGSRLVLRCQAYQFPPSSRHCILESTSCPRILDRIGIVEARICSLFSSLHRSIFSQSCSLYPFWIACRSELLFDDGQLCLTAPLIPDILGRSFACKQYKLCFHRC